jgi:restriction endonuclease S subunit
LSGGTPDTENPSYWGGDIPWITSSSLKGRYLDRSLRQLTKEGVAAGSRLVEPGTLIFVVRGMSLKSEFRVGIATRPVAFGQDCKALVPAQGIDPKYLLFALEAAEDRVLRMVDEASHGTGRLQTSLLGALTVRVPPLGEQRRIAEILDTIDETTQATGRVIAKVEVARQGLLDDLLGSIEHHERLGDVLDRIDAGWSPTCAERPPTGSEWGVLKVSSITREEFNPAASKTLPPSLPPRPDLIVRVGDVLTARANGVADLVGRTAIVDHLGGRRLLISDKTLRLVPGPRLSPRYLSYCMQHEMVRSQVRGLVSGSTGQGNISQAELRSLRLAIPPRQDQHAIEAAVTSVDDRLHAERSAMSKLQTLRDGIAADLLSGRVRTVVT